MSTTPTQPSGPVDPDKYATIKPIPEEGGFYQNFPGVYRTDGGKTQPFRAGMNRRPVFGFGCRV